jgi:hypothetical protein
VPGRPDLRLRTLADVVAYAAAEGVELRLDGTEVRVRRPRANKPGRRAFVSGKMRQNSKKATVVTDEKGRTLWAGAFRPGRMHDQTAVKTEGICEVFERHPQVKAKVDAGYRGLAKQLPDQVQTPPLKPRRTRRQKTSQPGTRPAISSHQSESASSTPTLNISSGGPSSGTSAAVSTSPRPTPPWPA